MDGTFTRAYRRPSDGLDVQIPFRRAPGTGELLVSLQQCVHACQASVEALNAERAALGEPPVALAPGAGFVRVRDVSRLIDYSEAAPVVDFRVWLLDLVLELAKPAFRVPA